MDLERVPLENGQLFLNTGCKCAEHVRNFVAARQYLDESRLQLLGQTYKAKVSKVLLGEDTPCVLKEMAVSWAKNPWKKAENAFRYRFRPRFLRTLKVALLARKAGISCYEPYAYWTDAREGLHIYFLCEFIEGHALQDEWMDGKYLPEKAAFVVAKFREVGEIGRRFRQIGMANADMIPRNCFLQEDGRIKLIDLDLAFPVRQHPKVSEFLAQMKAFRRFVSNLPLDENCLNAFLDGYTAGNEREKMNCMRMLEYFRRHSKHRSFSSIGAWFLAWMCQR